jgi:hypothetical protein
MHYKSARRSTSAWEYYHYTATFAHIHKVHELTRMNVTWAKRNLRLFLPP